MKLLIIVALLPLYLFSAAIVKPEYVIDLDADVVDMVRRGDKLYIATDAGKFEIYNWKKRIKLHEVAFDRIHDFMGDLIKPKVFCVDIDSSGKKIIALVEAENGWQTLYLYENGKLSRLLDENSKIRMAEVRFVDNDHLLIATISNELILLQIKDRKIIYRTKLGLSVFSDFQLNETHTEVASSAESGIVYVTDVKTGKLLHSFDKGNKDEVLHVDFKKNRVLACGKDKKAVIYSLDDGSMTIFPTGFMVFSGALSKDAQKSAFQIDEQSDIGVYSNISGSMEFKLKGHSSMLNTIVFVNDKELISAAEDAHILIWRLP